MSNIDSIIKELSDKHNLSSNTQLSYALQDYNYPNGQLLNILKAMYIYTAVSNIADHGDLRCLLNRLVRKTGYTRKELIDRIYLYN